MEFVNGWRIIPYILWKIIYMFETTKQVLWECEEGNRVVMELPGTSRGQIPIGTANQKYRASC